MTDVEKKWTEKAKKVLEGKTILGVRYLTKQEAIKMGWDKQPIVFMLDDGTMCILSSDDEGNNGGSLLYGTDGVLPTL